ncbi:hypothetical protein COMX_07630 [Commensalibacter papalotli (ex Servin-Garciduenas et al. 2014)]|uniref:Uncharacterized protein n=1 Tax=Commensalibacter papalotli (ex Servin-Garciduenas et al. 2014) TaxID=1208583 RepID=W7DKI0_9PROT|nr:hypothetical protein COMX_07630 [Commensalibacter papalotli (ex Servin-Garciduenas et al. 2014)]
MKNTVRIKNVLMVAKKIIVVLDFQPNIMGSKIRQRLVLNLKPKIKPKSILKPIQIYFRMNISLFY